jgi:hypothetical protein
MASDINSASNNENHPAVSVIIPAYNRSAMLREAVESTPDWRTYFTETIPTMEHLLHVCEDARRAWGGERPLYFVLSRGRPETAALQEALSESEHRPLWSYEAVEVYRLDCERLAAESPSIEKDLPL